jgi:hypothetical protein
MRPALPEPVRDYFESERDNNTQTMSDYFADNAVVRDENRTHTGIAAIRKWKEETKAATAYQVTPLKAEADGGQLIVTGRVEGSFPGSPVNLRYFFTLTGDRIAALEIRP